MTDLAFMLSLKVDLIHFIISLLITEVFDLFCNLGFSPNLYQLTIYGAASKVVCLKA